MEPDEEVMLMNEDINTIFCDLCNSSATICPECGGRIIYESGCNICVDCGWSPCH